MQIKYLLAALAAAATHVAATASPEAEPNAIADPKPVAAPEPLDLPDVSHPYNIPPYSPLTKPQIDDFDIDLLDKRQNVQDLTWNADDVPENDPRFQAYDRWALNRFNSRQGWNNVNRNRNWYGNRNRNRFGNRGRVTWRWCARLGRYDWC